MNVTAIIVAAGEGRRIGGNTPKIFLPLCGRAMILRTLDRFFSASTISSIVVVVAADQLNYAEAMLQADGASRARPWVLQSGGATRQESVRRGLEKAGADADIIAIHDGARPFVSSALIDRCVEAARDKGAVVVGLPVRDTIKIVAEDRWVAATPPRASLWEIQTPQVFRREIIAEAHAWAARETIEATDDATLVEKKGGRVFLLDGEKTNFKITLPDDIWVAETLIRQGRIP
jgi:2-C-methyl-D-erythritol 4-phosphate cytidylyltransferase/2-C-methyl-D-erythritol 4-phosphate cytidylyltransferase/2-C-methyl-D-erythritol 2,4-cyclodiphosphate synthase